MQRLYCRLSPSHSKLAQATLEPQLSAATIFRNRAIHTGTSRVTNPHRDARRHRQHRRSSSPLGKPRALLRRNRETQSRQLQRLIRRMKHLWWVRVRWTIRANQLVKERACDATQVKSLTKIARVYRQEVAHNANRQPKSRLKVISKPPTRASSQAVYRLEPKVARLGKAIKELLRIRHYHRAITPPNKQWMRVIRSQWTLNSSCKALPSLSTTALIITWARAAFLSPWSSPTASKALCARLAQKLRPNSRIGSLQGRPESLKLRLAALILTDNLNNRRAMIMQC